MKMEMQAKQHYSSAAMWAAGLKGLQECEKAVRWEMVRAEGPVSSHCQWDC